MSPAFQAPVLNGLKVYGADPFRLDFILNKGEGSGDPAALKTDSSRLIKYFLASLTIPEKDLWVNLSPYEKDRIVPDAFGRTEMGRDLLGQDYLLKQITASALYPQGETGREFWQKVYARAYEKFGTTDIPVDTFNKVWITPEKAVVYENSLAGSVYIVESRLKVMLESDYLAQGQHASAGKSVSRDDIPKQVLKDVVIPVLEQEVNEGKNFILLRQVYQSLILAVWYKKKIMAGILSEVYVDRGKVRGLEGRELSPEEIWSKYVEAFRKGAFNLIREEKDAFTDEVIPRKYFSGGMDLARGLGQVIEYNADMAMIYALHPGTGERLVVQVRVTAAGGLGVSFEPVLEYPRPGDGHELEDAFINEEAAQFEWAVRQVMATGINRVSADDFSRILELTSRGEKFFNPQSLDKFLKRAPATAPRRLLMLRGLLSYKSEKGERLFTFPQALKIAGEVGIDREESIFKEIDQFLEMRESGAGSPQYFRGGDIHFMVFGPGELAERMNLIDYLRGKTDTDGRPVFRPNHIASIVYSGRKRAEKERFIDAAVEEDLFTGKGMADLIYSRKDLEQVVQEAREKKQREGLQAGPGPVVQDGAGEQVRQGAKSEEVRAAKEREKDERIRERAQRLADKEAAQAERIRLREEARAEKLRRLAEQTRLKREAVKERARKRAEKKPPKRLKEDVPPETRSLEVVVPAEQDSEVQALVSEADELSQEAAQDAEALKEEARLLAALERDAKKARQARESARRNSTAAKLAAREAQELREQAEADARARYWTALADAQRSGATARSGSDGESGSVAHLLDAQKAGEQEWLADFKLSPQAVTFFSRSHVARILRSPLSFGEKQRAIRILTELKSPDGRPLLRARDIADFLDQFSNVNVDDFVRIWNKEFSRTVIKPRQIWEYMGRPWMLRALLNYWSEPENMEIWPEIFLREKYALVWGREPSRLEQGIVVGVDQVLALVSMLLPEEAEEFDFKVRLSVREDMEILSSLKEEVPPPPDQIDGVIRRLRGSYDVNVRRKIGEYMISWLKAEGLWNRLQIYVAGDGMAGYRDRMKLVERYVKQYQWPYKTSSWEGLKVYADRLRYPVVRNQVTQLGLRPQERKIWRTRYLLSRTPEQVLEDDLRIGRISRDVIPILIERSYLDPQTFNVLPQAPAFDHKWFLGRVRLSQAEVARLERLLKLHRRQLTAEEVEGMIRATFSPEDLQGLLGKVPGLFEDRAFPDQDGYMPQVAEEGRPQEPVTSVELVVFDDDGERSFSTADNMEAGGIMENDTIGDGLRALAVYQPGVYEALRAAGRSGQEYQITRFEANASRGENNELYGIDEPMDGMDPEALDQTVSRIRGGVRLEKEGARQVLDKQLEGQPQQVQIVIDGGGTYDVTGLTMADALQMLFEMKPVALSGQQDERIFLLERSGVPEAQLLTPQDLMNEPARKGDVLHIESLPQLAAADAAMNKNTDPASNRLQENTGGIDLNPAGLKFKVESAPGGDIVFKLDPAQVEKFKAAEGFVPVIIGIQPLGDLLQFLGGK
jgi:hypothetical protein